jgi:tetratricopeptide (TPR) repeat protein
MGIFTAVLIAALLSVPVMNKFVFHAPNLQQVKQEIGEKMQNVNDLLGIQDLSTARDSCASMVQKYSTKSDPISQFAAQWALFTWANSFRANSQFDQALERFDTLMKAFPRTPLAEQIFFLKGKTLEMRAAIKERRPDYFRAIEEYEKIERNRDLSRNFPKYRKETLNPGRFFNSDMGKKKIRNQDLMAKVYTPDDRIRDAETDTAASKGGEFLTDAVLAVGDCWVALDSAEKARDQYSLLSQYFSESDLVDDAQKKIAQTYAIEARAVSGAIADSLPGEEKKKQEEKVLQLYNQSVDNYLKFVNVYSQSDLVPDALLDLGGVYYDMKNEAKAMEVFGRAVNAIKESERQAKVILDIGNYYNDRKKYDNAIESYAKVLQNFSQTEFASNAQYLLGECYFAKKDTAEGTKAYALVTEYYKTSQFYPAAAYNLGRYYHQMRDFPKAIKFYCSGVQLFPNSAVADVTQYWIGMIFKEQAENAKDPEESKRFYSTAIKEFEIVIGNYGGREMAQRASFEIGRINLSLGKPDEAQKNWSAITDPVLLVDIAKIKRQEGIDIFTDIKNWEDRVLKSSDSTAKANALIELGKLYMDPQVNLLDSALTKFNYAGLISEDQVLSLNAVFYAGEATSSLGNFSKARELWQNQILTSPKTPQDLRVNTEFKIAESYRKEKKYQKSLDLFKEFRQAYPDDKNLTPYSQFLIAVNYQDLEELDKGLVELEKLFADFPESEILVSAALTMGTIYRSQKDPAKAINYWSKYLGDHGTAMRFEDKVNFIFQIGDTYYKDLQDYQNAVTSFDKIIGQEDSVYFGTVLWSPAAYQAGMAFEKLEKEKEARRSFMAVKKDDKEYYRAAQGEIGALIARNNPDSAILYYQNIINNEENVEYKTIAQMGIGDVYTKQKDWARAAKAYEIIYTEYVGATEGNRAASLVKMIDALNNNGKFQEVIRWANVMIQAFPNNQYTENAFYFKANASFSLKQYGDARLAFTEVIKNSQSDNLKEVAVFQKSDCLLFMEKYDEALREYAAFRRLYPQSEFCGTALFQEGNCYYSQAQWQPAMQKFQEVVKTYPNFSAICWARNNLAFCQNKLGYWKEARTNFTQVARGSSCEDKAKQFARKFLDEINVKH